MSYLFHINEKKKTVLHPYAIQLCQELAMLNEQEIMFIILAFDYNSPYKQFPERQRLSKAIWRVWEDNKPNILDEEKRDKKLKLAINAYKSLQYNHNEELKIIYQKKIEQAQSEILTEEAPNRLKHLREIISGFRADIRELDAEIVETNINQSELKNDRELSLLETWQTNIKHYDSLRFKK